MSKPGTVCFAHGMESGPWGTKITHLAALARARGWTALSPDYSFTKNPQERVRYLLANPPQEPRPLVLIGSSMGAYVAAQACAVLKPAALFLMAPALYFPGWDEDPQDCPADTVVVHGWQDDVVSVDAALRFSRPRHARLHVLDSGHTLNDQLPMLGLLFEEQLKRVEQNSG